MRSDEITATARGSSAPCGRFGPGLVARAARRCERGETQQAGEHDRPLSLHVPSYTGEVHVVPRGRAFDVGGGSEPAERLRCRTAMRRRTVLLLAAVGCHGGDRRHRIRLPRVRLPGRSGTGIAELGARIARDGPTVADGAWTVAPLPTNFVGYRVRERLGPVAAPSDAVSATRRVTGTIRIDGHALTALDISVDVASLDSGSSRRDAFVREEALDVDRFPTAGFRLDGAVELGTPARGRVMDLPVRGRLTLRGETRPVTFAVQARWNGASIQAAGTTRIERSDFGIDVSSRAGFNIDEEGTIEFELTFGSGGSPVDAPPPTLVDNRAPATDEGEFRPPCRSDEQVTLDPPVLVTGGIPGSSLVEIVRGSGRLVPVHSTPGLTGGASWSPDSTEIAFSSSASPEAPRTLSVAAVSGSSSVPVPGLSDVTHPDWGADGRIAFVQWDGEDSDIWITDRRRHARRLVETPGIDTDPRWSPDGRTIAFTTVGRRHNQDIVLVDSDGSDLETLAGGRGYEYAPSFTPDGRDVLFARDGSVFTIGVDGKGEQRLTTGPSDTNPEASADGRQIAFIRDGSLHVAADDGSGPRCVMTDQAITGGPRWSAEARTAP